jgi:hypothetical protein
MVNRQQADPIAQPGREAPSAKVVIIIHRICINGTIPFHRISGKKPLNDRRLASRTTHGPSIICLVTMMGEITRVFKDDCKCLNFGIEADLCGQGAAF